MKTSRVIPLMLLVLLTASCRTSEERWVATAPAGDAYTAIDQDGTTVLPNGRVLTPRGRAVMVAPHPYGLVLSPDGEMAVTANSGVRPFSISILRNLTGANPTVQQVPEGVETDEGILAAVFMGLAIAPDGETLYVGGGQEGRVIVFDLASGVRVGDVDANVTFDGTTFEDSYIGDLVLSEDGRTLYAVDQTNFRMIVIDVADRRVIASVPVGRYPFGVTLTPDGTRAYVANVGMYEYSLLEGLDEDADLPRLGVTFPPFAQGSVEASEGVEAEGYTVPGLGDPNAPESFSVWGVDVTDHEAATVVSRIKTGYLVGEKIEDFPTIGGSSPNSLVSTDDRVFVSNGNNDAISVIDIRRDTVVADIFLQLDERLGSLRGQIPFGLALSPDGGRLYVAEAGINAVAVVDAVSFEVLGHIPVGWFPSKLAVTPDGKQLIVANAKGYGSGPNGGPDFDNRTRGSFIGNLMNGFVSVIDIPDDAQLPSETAQVVSNNFRFEPTSSPVFADRGDNPIPLYPGEKESPIKHLVFITKENRTYDEVFGQLESGRGEPSLARYGIDVTFSNRDRTITVENAPIMPNHLSLAEQFAIGDNFYCDSDVSADGHRWLVGIYPNEWVETSVAASYGGGRRMNLTVVGSRHAGFRRVLRGHLPGGLQRSGVHLGPLRPLRRGFFQLRTGIRVRARDRDPGFQIHRHPFAHQLPHAGTAPGAYVPEIRHVQHQHPRPIPCRHVHRGIRGAVARGGCHDAFSNHDDAAQRPRSQRTPGRRIPVRGELHGRQRLGVGPCHRVSVTHSILAGDGHYRDGGRSPGRRGPPGRAPQHPDGHLALREARLCGDDPTTVSGVS